MVKEENENCYCSFKLNPAKYFVNQYTFGTNVAALKERLIARFFIRIGSILAISRKSPESATASEVDPKYNEGPVKIVVGENFEKRVMNSKRDAFIEFYSPDCRYCQELEPIWDRLGEQMKSEDVDIMKMDVTANAWNVERYIVESLPTIYWEFANKTKLPIKYTYPRTMTHFIKFAATNATDELRGWDREGKPKHRKP